MDSDPKEFSRSPSVVKEIDRATRPSNRDVLGPPTSDDRPQHGVLQLRRRPLVPFVRG